LLLINPEHYKAVRGKKTDLKDGTRIAELLITLLPSASLSRQAAIIFLCTSRPQQLRFTLMALLLYPWRRRPHSKILPNELS